MKKYLPIIIIMMVVVFGGLLYLSLRDDSMPPNGATQELSTAVQDGNKMAGDSRYLEYSSDVLSATSSSKRVLFFYANWCPTCRPADASFKANLDKIPEGVALIRVNYNDSDTDAEESALADKWCYLPTHICTNRRG